MPTTLVSVPELAARLDDPRWVAIDCRHDLADPAAGRRAWAAGHVRGVPHAHLDADLSGPPTPRTSPGGQRIDGGRHPLPGREALRERLQAWGVGDDTQLVALDAHGGLFASRLWWLARWLGHERVAVLDGGLPAWSAAGLPLETGPAAARPRGRLSGRPPLAATVDVDDVVANLRAPRFQLVDARAPDRFRGENETLDPVGGHIPGAVNRFFRDNLAADGRFKPAATLREEWTALLRERAGRAGEVVLQCGSGVTACHDLLALEIAGLHGAALYAGSWSEWVSGEGRPVAR